MCLGIYRIKSKPVYENLRNHAPLRKSLGYNIRDHHLFYVFMIQKGRRLRRALLLGNEYE